MRENLSQLSKLVANYLDRGLKASEEKKDSRANLDKSIGLVHIYLDH